jgi:hypothetical protein
MTEHQLRVPFLETLIRYGIFDRKRKRKADDSDHAGQSGGGDGAGAQRIRRPGRRLYRLVTILAVRAKSSQLCQHMSWKQHWEDISW